MSQKAERYSRRSSAPAGAKTPRASSWPPTRKSSSWLARSGVLGMRNQRRRSAGSAYAAYTRAGGAGSSRSIVNEPWMGSEFTASACQPARI